MTRCKYFHDDQIEGAWCEIKPRKLNKRLDCSKCENNPELPRCETCVHFMFGSPNCRCAKVRGDIIADGVIQDYTENMKVRESQVACNFYTEEQ